MINKSQHHEAVDLGREWGGLELGVSKCKLVHFEWMGNEVLHRELDPISWDKTQWRMIRGKKHIFVHVYVPVCVCVCVCVCVWDGVTWL